MNIDELLEKLEACEKEMTTVEWVLLGPGINWVIQFIKAVNGE